MTFILILQRCHQYCNYLLLCQVQGKLLLNLIDVILISTNQIPENTSVSQTSTAISTQYLDITLNLSMFHEAVNSLLSVILVSKI